MSRLRRVSRLLRGSLAAAPLACAAQAPLSQVWINPGFYSLHFDRHADLEDVNPGLGVEWPLNDSWSLTGGIFRNSNRERSHYVGAYWMPLEFWGVRFGAAMGAFDGYPNYRDGGWFPAVIPTAAIEGRHWGLNVAILPELKDRLYGAITFQLKFRFDAPAQQQPAPAP